jgi:hypothetical protein
MGEVKIWKRYMPEASTSHAMTLNSCEMHQRNLIRCPRILSSWHMRPSHRQACLHFINPIGTQRTKLVQDLGLHSEIQRGGVTVPITVNGLASKV